jgi:hypothetical protein
MSTTFVSSTQLTATIPASAIAIAGNPYVIVINPKGINSAHLPFTINNPQPGGGAITPPSGPAGSGDLILNVTGTGFVQGPPGSTVYVNGTSRVTKYVSATLLQATLLASDLAQGGTLNLTVVNPIPGGGISPVIQFTVTDYSLVSTNPTTSVTAGQTANFGLTVSPLDGAFSNSVMLSVSGLPTGATYAFAPSAAITPGATPKAVTLSISTTSRSSGVLTLRRPSAMRTLPKSTVLPLAFLTLLTALLFILARPHLEPTPIRTGGRPPQVFSLRGMALFLLLALLGLGAIEEGCGVTASSSTSTSAPTVQINMAGNWSISTTSAKFGIQRSLTGTIAQNGSTIFGSLNISGSPCAQVGSLSGSLNANMITASLIMNGQSVTLTGTVTADANSASGSYSAPVGGCTNGETGTWFGTRAGVVGNPNGTPAGTYPITLNATSGGVSHSTNITLTVM